MRTGVAGGKGGAGKMMSNIQYGPAARARFGTAEENTGRLVARARPGAGKPAETDRPDFIMTTVRPGVRLSGNRFDRRRFKKIASPIPDFMRFRES